MSEKEINIEEKAIEAHIASILHDFAVQYQLASTKGKLKRNAYIRLRDQDLLHVDDIKVQYYLIANKQCKLPSDERALIVYIVNTATSKAINERLKELDELKVRDKIDIKDNG